MYIKCHANMDLCYVILFFSSFFVNRVVQSMLFPVFVLHIYMIMFVIHYLQHIQCYCLPLPRTCEMLEHQERTDDVSRKLE